MVPVGGGRPGQQVSSSEVPVRRAQCSLRGRRRTAPAGEGANNNLILALSSSELDLEEVFLRYYRQEASDAA